jgi:outer membrane protein TolC
MRALVVGIATALAACVPARSTLWRPVDAQVQRRLGVAPTWANDGERPDPAIAALLAKPLELDGAIRIALATNRHLQASYAELGVAAGELAAATLPGALHVDAEYKLGIGAGHEAEPEVHAIQDVLGLVALGPRRGAADDRLAAARARAVAATIRLAGTVELAYWDVVAAQDLLAQRRTAFDAADAAAELAERMHAAGNTTALALARERAQREDARVDVGRAEVEVETRREAFNQALGLTGDATAWTIAAHLPEPAAPPALDTLETDAVTASLELAALRDDAEAARRDVGVARLQSWLPALGVGAAAARHDGEWSVGPAIRIGLPIFDQGQGARARAWASLRRAEHAHGAAAVDLRAAARATRQRVLGAHAEARHLRDVVLPLRREVVAETLRQYNAMNASTFELLAARRALAETEARAIEAQRRLAAALAEATALRRGVRLDAPTGDAAGDAPAAPTTHAPAPGGH